MFHLSPSFTLVLILFLGAASHSSPLFPRSFIDPEASEENEMIDKRSYNPFSHAHAYGFNFGKIRGRTVTTSRSHYTPKEDWMSRVGEEDTMKMSKRSYNPYATAGYWNPRGGGFRNLMVGSLGGMGGWFQPKTEQTNEEYPAARAIVETQIKSPKSAGFGVSYGRG